MERWFQISGKMNRFLFTSIAIDKEGYLDINIDFERDTWIDENGKWQQTKQRKTREYCLWHLMSNVKKKAVDSAIKFISWKKAILDYMNEEGFIIKTYTDMIYSMNEEIQTPIIGWTKYQSDEESFIPEIPEKRVDKLKTKYAITPDIKNLEVDLEIYYSFRSTCLE